MATCVPTMNARYGDSGAATFRSRAQLPPMTAGSSTLCPRLETGNSSETPLEEADDGSLEPAQVLHAGPSRDGSDPSIVGART